MKHGKHVYSQKCNYKVQIWRKFECEMWNYLNRLDSEYIVTYISIAVVIFVVIAMWCFSVLCRCQHVWFRMRYSTVARNQICATSWASNEVLQYVILCLRACTHHPEIRWDPNQMYEWQKQMRWDENRNTLCTCVCVCVCAYRYVCVYVKNFYFHDPCPSVNSINSHMK